MASPDLMNSIIDQATRLATHSWEYGTLAQALLEWNSPEISVFGADPFPDGQIPSVSVDDTPSLSYAISHISTDGDTLVNGDGSAGDPASLGVPAIMIGQTDQAYLDAAGRQVAHLTDSVPRWENGAISHRENVAELWADSVYMMPPTLAYYAVATGDVDLLREALNQCTQYRDVLAVEEGGDGPGLWHHIIGPESEDYGLWSTGNGWAAAGMARVLATATKSPFADELESERTALSDAIRAIIDGAMTLDASEPDEPLLRNYLVRKLRDIHWIPSPFLLQPWLQHLQLSELCH